MGYVRSVLDLRSCLSMAGDPEGRSVHDLRSGLSIAGGPAGRSMSSRGRGRAGKGK